MGFWVGWMADRHDDRRVNRISDREMALRECLQTIVSGSEHQDSTLSSGEVTQEETTVDNNMVVSYFILL